MPGRVTEMPATAQPKRVAWTMSRPSARATAKPPLKASPAPVVSTTGPASTAGTWARVAAVLRKAPCAPRVMTALRTPRARKASAACSAVASEVTRMPVRTSASLSLGVT